MFTARYDLNLNVIQINFRLWEFTVTSLHFELVHPHYILLKSHSSFRNTLAWQGKDC